MMKLVLTIHTLWTHLDCWYSCNWSRSHSHSFAMSFESLQSSQMADLWSLTHSLNIFGFPMLLILKASAGEKTIRYLAGFVTPFPIRWGQGALLKDTHVKLGETYLRDFSWYLHIQYIYIRFILCIYCKNSRQTFDLKKTKQTQYPSGILRFTSNPLVAVFRLLS